MANKKNLDYDDEFKMEKVSYKGIIILVIMMALVFGMGYYYYKVLDNPKNLFTSFYDKLFSFYHDKYSMDYNLNYNLSGKFNINNPEYMDYNILNDLVVSGIIERNNKEIKTNSVINYNGDKLLSFTSLSNSSEEVYIYLDDIYDKVIKYVYDHDYNYDVDSYKIVMDSFMEAFKDSMDMATYSKKYIKLDSEYVKKNILVIDKPFIQNMYDKLLNDNSFLNSLAVITGDSISDIKNEISKEISDIEEIKYELVMYTSIITNKFIRIELNMDEDSIVIFKEDNDYVMEYTENYSLKFEGYIKYNKVGDDTSVTLGLNFIDDKVSMELYGIYSDSNEDVTLDVSNSVLSSEITEEEVNKIYEKIASNDSIMNFLEKISGEEEDYSNML